MVEMSLGLKRFFNSIVLANILPDIRKKFEKINEHTT